MKSSRELQMVMAMTAGLGVGNMFNHGLNSDVCRSTNVRPSGATTTSKKKRKSQAKARKKNHKKKK